MASAVASISRLRASTGSCPAGMRCCPVRPQMASASIARARASSLNQSVGYSPARPKVLPTSTLVRTVWLSKATVVWKVRAMPSRQMSWARRPWISRSLNLIAPLVAGLTPEMQSKRDVLPAPLGPTIAKTSPGSTAKLRLLTARSPP